MSKLIEYKEITEWLGSDATFEDVVGMLLDVANGMYSWEELSADIKDYSEHNQ